jgi:hypothetical protein
MINAHEIEQKIALVAKGKLSLNAFEDWFVPNSWNVHKDSTFECIDLVSSIHHLLSERDDHILNESDLRRELRLLLESRVHYVRIVYSEAQRVPKLATPSFEVRRSSPPVYARAIV